jgi:Iron-containing redox enzyme
VQRLATGDFSVAHYAQIMRQVFHQARENPHPGTAAVTAFAFHQINNGNPVGYLGYLFFLEFLPTSQGEGLMKGLKAAGVPANAFTFLEDHVRVDIGHNKAMERYCADLITTQEALDTVIYAMRTTGYLYTNMINAAVENADAPQSYGVTTSLTPSALQTR